MDIGTAESYENLRREIQELTSPWRTIKQAASYMQVSDSMVHHLIKAGELKVRFVGGGHPRLHTKDLDAQMWEQKRKREEKVSILRKQHELPLEPTAA